MVRTLEDMMKNVAAKMANKNADPIQKNTSPCLCQNRYYFVKRKENGERVFAVCPNCNPRLSCKVCNSTGTVLKKNPHTNETEALPNGCECIVWENRVRKLNDAGIPEKYLLAEFSFDNIRFGKKHLPPKLAEQFENNQAKIRDFCDHANHIIRNGVEPGSKYTLGLVGPVGSGKTFLGVCALKDLIWQYGHSGKFIDFQALLHKIRDTYTKNLSEDDIMDPLRKADILLIDEFGKGRAEKEWEMEKLDDLVNSRYNNGRITILTTNYVPNHLGGDQTVSKPIKSPNPYWATTETSPKNHVSDTYQTLTLAERIGERMFDRIQETTEWVNFTGIPSFRKKMAESFLEHVKKDS